jgi:hypothetical protein
MNHPFANKKILLASQHRKEEAIAKPIKQYLQSELVIFPFDTDQFGSFTGEIPRPGAQRETLIKKAKAAANQYGYSYVIASEGSFGPHPAMPWVPAGLEMVCFYDTSQDRVIVESAWSSTTNYAQFYWDARVMDKTPDAMDALDAFLRQVGFPSHGLVLKVCDTKQAAGVVLAKGIQDPAQWQTLFAAARKKYANLKIETDMRAHLNPTRMTQIANLAEQLVQRLVCLCPQCEAPGFGERSLTGHLPCASCQAPTRIAAYECLRCDCCQAKTMTPRHDSTNPADSMADPRYCDFCNP